MQNDNLPCRPPAETAAGAARRSILNFNENMEYRRLGRTGLMVSAVCLGGHWKRVDRVLGKPFQGAGYDRQDFENINDKDFLRNRHDVVSRSIDAGINYIDACSGPEVLAYARVLKGRRDRMYLGYSWHTRESRFDEWRSARKLLEGLDQGLRDAGLDYVDLWRISLPMDPLKSFPEAQAVEEGAMEALELARRQGKSRHAGISGHSRDWLRSILEKYPGRVEVVLFPYTAASRRRPENSIFDTVRRHDVGVFAIKPFADNSLFLGDGSPGNPHARADDERARLALRHILGNTAISAPVPGLASVAQVDNAARAVVERRALDAAESRQLDAAARDLWENLHPGHEFLRDWESV